MGERLLPDGSMMDNKLWLQVRKRAIAMYDPVCALCGNPIDMEAPAKSPMSLEVDHIIPVSRGGDPYAIDNLQLTHMRCNRQKSNHTQWDDDDFANSDNLCPISNNW